MGFTKKKTNFLLLLLLFSKKKLLALRWVLQSRKIVFSNYCRRDITYLHYSISFHVVARDGDCGQIVLELKRKIKISSGFDEFDITVVRIATTHRIGHEVMQVAEW